MANDNVLNDEFQDFVTAGWDSIDAKLAELYPDVAPIHYGTIVKWAIGGPDPLDGVSIYRNPGPPDHWHYISYGLTELYNKESDTEAFSGYGFEFTFRLAVEPGEEDSPPTWPIGLMQNLARYVFETGNVFDYGHRIPLNSPILKGSQTLLCGAMFVLDPELGRAESANGNYIFLQIIGTTSDELDAAEAWSTNKFIELLARDNKLLVTTLSRKSILDDPQIAETVKQGIEKDGSTCGTLYVSDSEIELDGTPDSGNLTFKILEKDLSSVHRLLAGRLLHGRELTLVSASSRLRIVPAETNNWALEAESDSEQVFCVSMNPTLVRNFLDAMDSGGNTFSFPELERFSIATKRPPQLSEA